METNNNMLIKLYADIYQAEKEEKCQREVIQTKNGYELLQFIYNDIRGF